MIKRNDPCWCGSGTKWKACCSPKEGPPPSFGELREKYKKQFNIRLKNKNELDGVKAACALTKLMLKEVCSLAKEGVTTKDLDNFVRRRCKEENARPAALGVGDPPFPGSICTSLNDVICHGIPDDTPLVDGDILNIDLVLVYNNFFGDSSRMVLIGEVSEEKKRVVDVSYNSLMKAISILRPGILIKEIGDVIETHAEQNGCSVVDQFVGHGVGFSMHENPQVPHHRNNSQIPLAEGMVIAIEPMINAGVVEGYIEQDNGWVARTVDGKPSAQWEHTIAITEDGCEILT